MCVQTECDRSAAGSGSDVDTGNRKEIYKGNIVGRQGRLTWALVTRVPREGFLNSIVTHKNIES